MARFIHIALAGILITLLTSHLVPLEFRSQDTRDEYHVYLILASPILVFGLVLIDYIKNRENRMIIVSLIGGAILAGFTLIFVGILGFSNYNFRGIETTLFINRFNDELQIVFRDDFDQNLHQSYLLTPFTPWFQWRQKTDTLELNPYKWVSVKRLKKLDKNEYF